MKFGLFAIPGTVGAALFLGLDILLDGGLPLLLVSLVDGVDLPPGLHLDTTPEGTYYQES